MSTKIYMNLVFILLLFTVTSCDDEEPMVNIGPEKTQNERINEDIEGTWDVTSARIDGDENVNDGVEDFTMKFTIETETGGELRWKFNDFGTDVNWEDNYEIRRDGEELDWSGSEFTILKLTSSELDLEGNLNGSFWQIQSEK